ncbi:MAG TPA: metallopeptidase TldD-related protein [Kofleriaceae bacterium]|jgi:predicted Zn-dependent protease
MISRKALANALRDRRLADWVVIERDQDLASARRDRVRREDRMVYSVVVHIDTPRGRGSARVEITSSDGSARAIVDRAIDLATAALGAPWRAPPPSAPARVALVDPALVDADLADLAAHTVASWNVPNVSLDGSLDILRERVSVETQAGLKTGWPASLVRANIRVATETASMAIAREARQLVDLDLQTAFNEASHDFGLVERAQPTTSGKRALVLRPEALLHGGGLGLWDVFAAHATAELERQGLVRYRLKAPIAAGANSIDEPITITSDGSLDYGTRSAPLSEEGAAVRRFAIVENGIASGLGMSMREAARRKLEPNGGVRNLVVSSGTWVAAAPAIPSVEVHRLRSFSIDPYTGDATLEIALATDSDGTNAHVIKQGQIRLDLVSALAHAKRSATPLRRGAYFGPDAVLIENVELLA